MRRDYAVLVLDCASCCLRYLFDSGLEDLEMVDLLFAFFVKKPDPKKKTYVKLMPR